MMKPSEFATKLVTVIRDGDHSVAKRDEFLDFAIREFTDAMNDQNRGEVFRSHHWSAIESDLLESNLTMGTAVTTLMRIRHVNLAAIDSIKVNKLYSFLGRISQWPEA